MSEIKALKDKNEQRQKTIENLLKRLESNLYAEKIPPHWSIDNVHFFAIQREANFRILPTLVYDKDDQGNITYVHEESAAACAKFIKLSWEYAGMQTYFAIIDQQSSSYLPEVAKYLNS